MEADKLLADHQSLVNAGKSRSKEAKAIRSRLDAIASAATEDAKPLVKEFFDYEIPIAKIDDAGITSTGAASAGNQLPALEEEYAKYRHAKSLWDESKKSVLYRQGNLGEIIRVENGEEVTLHGDN